ncbi:MAG: DUF6036 family nucleotidyltransferase [Planctomycetota bacterium]
MSRESVEQLIDRIIEFWNKEQRSPLNLYLMGGAAVLMQFGGALTTKDVDVSVTSTERDQLEQALGDFMCGGSKVSSNGVYLDLIGDSFPPMPWLFRERSTLDREVALVKIWRLHPVDMVLSKIRRFSAKDRRDIETVIENCSEDMSANELRRVFSEEQFYFEPDLEERSLPRLERIIAFLNGSVDTLD